MLIRNLSQFHIPSFFLCPPSPSLVFSHLSLFTQRRTELIVFMWSSKEHFLISTLLKFHLRIIILRQLPWYEKWLQFYLDKKTLTLAQPIPVYINNMYMIFQEGPSGLQWSGWNRWTRWKLQAPPRALTWERVGRAGRQTLTATKFNRFGRSMQI